MVKGPPAGDFPGSGGKGKGIREFDKSQHGWIDTVKNACQSCHAIGTKGVRSPSPKLGEFKDSKEMWTRRLQSGQAMENMSIVIARLGPDKGVSLYADWTDRVAKGELPFAKPERPKGIERNVVITEWGWSTPTHYLHDQISTDKRKPTINSNWLIYVTPTQCTEEVTLLDQAQQTHTPFQHT